MSRKITKLTTSKQRLLIWPNWAKTKKAFITTNANFRIVRGKVMSAFYISGLKIQASVKMHTLQWVCVRARARVRWILYLWLCNIFQVLCIHLCWSCKARCAYPCRWATAVKKWRLLVLLKGETERHTERQNPRQRQRDGETDRERDRQRQRERRGERERERDGGGKQVDVAWLFTTQSAITLFISTNVTEAKQRGQRTGGDVINQTPIAGPWIPGLAGAGLLRKLYRLMEKV